LFPQPKPSRPRRTTRAAAQRKSPPPRARFREVSSEMEAFGGFFVDEKAARVENIFLEFLRRFKEADAAEAFYETELEAMRSRESTTMYVDFAHVMRFNDVLQKAISEEYLRFEPYLRNACKRFVMEQRTGENRAPIISDDSPNKDINIAFYNIPMLKRLRELGTAEIGKLTAVMGVVTRTSEVRPELLQGTFKCLDCGNVVKNVEQQFKYTEVVTVNLMFYFFLSCNVSNERFLLLNFSQ
jgi:DNA replication licensing factor MCM6